MFALALAFHLLALLDLSVFGQSLAEDLICPFHVGAGEAGSDAASIVDGHKILIVPSVAIAWHPIAPLRRRHPPQLAFPLVVPQLHPFDFVEVYDFVLSEGEEVARDDDPVVADDDVLVLVEDIVVCHVINYKSNNLKGCRIKLRWGYDHCGVTVILFSSSRRISM